MEIVSILFIHLYKTNFLKFFLFYIITVDLSNSDNHSKASAFKKSKRLLYKYYPMFSKIQKIVLI